jgi:SMI1 / KNR4 family (SUKH-1)
MVARGEYLDEIPGIPGAALGGGGAFTRSADGRVRRMYRRGSPEHFQAVRSGLIDRLPALAVAEPGAVAEAEATIGFQLPPLLRRLYVEVANGGFGPGYGILGIRAGHKDDSRRTALDLYRQAHDGPSAWWPFLQPSLLPICHWGCGIYSFVDCALSDGPMWGWDPNPGPSDETALFPSDVNFAEWLDKWIDGRLYQPTLVQDEEAGRWRGATDAELERWVAEA